MNIHKIAYTRPAASWQETMLLGNGKLGAMVYGNPDTELIHLNLDTLWSGEPDYESAFRRNVTKEIEKIREYVLKEEYDKAEEYADENLVFERSQYYLPFGDLHINTISEMGGAYDYSRSLNMQTGEHQVTYKKEINYVIENFEGYDYHMDTFISTPDDVMVVKYYADHGQKVSLTTHFDCALKNKVWTEDDAIHVSGMAPYKITADSGDRLHYDENRNSVRFHMQLKVVAPGGKIVRENTKLTVFDADEIILFISGCTNYVDYKTIPDKDIDLQKICIEKTENAAALGYEPLLERQKTYFSERFDRVSLKLCDSTECMDMERLVRNFWAGQISDELVEILFNYGRYLLLAGSAEGSQAMNLQGIWNRDLMAQWRCNYTININTEMNYWPAEKCNLPECHQPMLELVKEVVEAGEKTAREMYGCRGSVAHHNTDLWRKTTPTLERARWSLWPMSLGWFTSHLWEHYLYQPDREYLEKTVYPATEKCVEFYFDWLQEKDGYYVTIPSTSPENEFIWNGTNSSIAFASAMDIGILTDLFKRYLKMSEILQIQNEKTICAKEMLEKFPPYQVTADGRLMEWGAEFEESEPGHRHFSHLYGIFPGSSITSKNKEIFEAARKSLDVRMEHGSGQTGWSCAWVISLYAAFLDGEKAYEAVKKQIAESMYLNLMDAHPPFQIDGNFGFTAGICEMLMQSHIDEDNIAQIHILPAIPEGWKEGEVRGLRARGGAVLDICWRDGKAFVSVKKGKTECQIYSDKFECEIVS